MLKNVIFLANTLSDTLDIMCLTPISNLLKENLDYTYCCVIQSNAIAMKYFSLVAVMLIECVEGKCMQRGGGQEYAHPLDHRLNYSVLFSLKFYKPCVYATI